MIPKVELVSNLTRLDQLFNASLTAPITYSDANYYAKLAVLEVSAWLEECIETIYKDLSVLQLTVTANLKDYNSMIKRNHGFNYEDYLRNKLAINLTGLILIEKMESELGTKQKFQDMKAALNSLTTLRGSLAHTHLTGATPTVQAVSNTIELLNDAVAGLLLIEAHLRRLRFR